MSPADDDPSAAGARLATLLARYPARTEIERHDVDRTMAMATSGAHPWSRATALHATASALVVHRPTARVLLRWHGRQQAWIQVGGHGDAGEHDAQAIARREAHEETGLDDLVALADDPVHVVIVQVPANAVEPAHEHADLRYAFATNTPDGIVAESADAPLRWCAFDEAEELTGEDNVRETLHRVQALLAGP